MTNKMDFIDKNILVGGSTNGIGWSSAKQFAERGGNVTLVSRNIDLLKQRVSTLFNNGAQKHFIIPLDFSKPIELEQSLKEFISKNSIDTIEKFYKQEYFNKTLASSNAYTFFANV